MKLFVDLSDKAIYICISLNDNEMKTTLNYKGFQIEETMQESGATTAVAYFNGQVMFGTFSHLDTLTACEKMVTKINNYLNK